MVGWCEEALGLLRRPAVAEMAVDVLLCAVPIWAAVMIGLVVGWAWRPRWTGLLFLGLRGRLRILCVPPGFGARRLWLACTALSACSVAPRLLSSAFRRHRGKRQDKVSPNDASADATAAGDVGACADGRESFQGEHGMVTENDLDHLLQLLDSKESGDTTWQHLMERTTSNMTYKAWWREPENISSHEGQIRFLVYVLENAILSAPEGQDKMVWLIDFTGWTLANAVPMKIARESTIILQNHYPERLAAAFLFNPPKVFEAFYKVVKIFLDPKSIEKVNFVYQKNEESMKVMYNYIDPEVLPVDYGGKNNVVYNHDEYSELMIKDDIKTVSFWAADAKTDRANHDTNGTLV